MNSFTSTIRPWTLPFQEIAEFIKDVSIGSDKMSDTLAKAELRDTCVEMIKIRNDAVEVMSELGMWRQRELDYGPRELIGLTR